MSMFKWDVVNPAPGEAVGPRQRLPWGKTVGVGAQHVVAMFGATFVFPIVMGGQRNGYLYAVTYTSLLRNSGRG